MIWIEAILESSQAKLLSVNILPITKPKVNQMKNFYDSVTKIFTSAIPSKKLPMPLTITLVALDISSI